MSTDYFPPIQRAVQGLSPNSHETRNALYEKARAALLRQLNAADPALTQSQISRERGLLEEAIRRVEHHYDEAALVPEPVVSERPAAPGRAEAVASQVDTPQTPEPESRDDSLPAFAERKSEKRRPQAPRRNDHSKNFKRYGLMAAAGLVLIVGGAGTALFMRSGDSAGGVPPQIIAEPGKTTPPPVQSEPAKFGDRIGDVQPPSSGASAPATTTPAPQPVAPAEIPAPVSTTPSPLLPPAQDQAPIGQRAHFIEEDPAAPNKTRVFEGTVNWHTESQPSGNNGPLETAIVGTVDFADRKLKAVLTLRHNNDPALPATYVMQIQLAVPADYPNGGINELKGIAVSADPEQNGDLLDGAFMRVSTGTFLLGMIDPPDEKGREARLLKNYPWFQVMFTFENGRRGMLTFEKGADGSKVFEEAMTAWAASASAAQP